jgi:hypothetical protein
VPNFIEIRSVDTRMKHVDGIEEWTRPPCNACKERTEMQSRKQNNCNVIFQNFLIFLILQKNRNGEKRTLKVNHFHQARLNTSHVR